MFLDALLVLLGLLLIILGIYRRLIGAAFLLAGTYVATLISALAYEEVAYRLQAIGHNTLWFEALVFILLYLSILLVFFIVSRIAYPDTSIPKIGFLDAVLGAVVGIPIAIASMAMVYRGIGYMVSEMWQPFDTYSNIYTMWASSRIGPLANSFLSAYLYLIYPFFVKAGLPPVFQ
jgi:uncharacterized membrane protein required for colicin V production